MYLGEKVVSEKEYRSAIVACKRVEFDLTRDQSSHNELMIRRDGRIRCVSGVVCRPMEESMIKVIIGACRRQRDRRRRSSIAELVVLRDTPTRPRCTHLVNCSTQVK
jgi:hypothetical protein